MNNPPGNRLGRAWSLPWLNRANWRLALLVLLALCLGTLAYQARLVATLNVGWLGDQLFLPTSAGLGQADADAGRWFGDELNETSPTLRSRWTRQQARVLLPDVGGPTAATLIITAQGWPASTVAQPTITVAANGQSLGGFTATSNWAEYRIPLPAAAFQQGNLDLRLTSDQTLVSSADPRPKGVRVARLQLVDGASHGAVMPPLRPLALLAFTSVLGFLVLRRTLRRPNVAFALACSMVLAGAYGLAFTRIWAAAALPWLAGTALLALAVAFSGSFFRLAARLGDRFVATNAFAVGAVVALVAGVSYLAWKSVLSLAQAAPGILLVLLLAVGSLLAARVPGLVRLAQAIAAWLATRRGATAVLVGFLTLWLGYELYLIATLPGVGHADYADNAVVARNLVRGRGWVVDYVTQFYRLYPLLTRPQETWPLLQPVWITPFFLLFGPTDWAAKLPNLIATGILGVLVYRFGAQVWDRRVGLLAAILLLTSNLFVLLVINVTSDLIFVLLAFAVVSGVYAWGGGRHGDTKTRSSAERASGRQQSALSRFLLTRSSVPWFVRSVLLGILTGLMFLQKPANGVFAAAGCGLWLLVQIWRNRRQEPNAGGQRLRNRRVWQRPFVQALGGVVVWTVVASVILLPYLVRNDRLSAQTNHIYGSLVYSTESRDAWVWGYAPREFYIYQIYTPEGGLSETQGLPDRSWILRWGFDRTLAKVERQVEAVRDYLAPVWVGLPNNLSDIVSGRDEKRLFFEVGAWLSFLGALIVLRRRCALVGLIVLAFLPYTLFLVAYWHADEERYFVALMPWLALFAALAIWCVHDQVARLAGGRFAPFALLLALVLAGSVVGPSIPIMQQKIVEWHYADSDRLAYAWLRTNTAPDAAVMTRVPWQLNWHSERPALMIPATKDRTRLLQLARYYGVRYLSFDVGQRPDQATQQMIKQMVTDPALGFHEEYRSPILFGDVPTLIYRFPDNYGNVPELRP